MIALPRRRVLLAGAATLAAAASARAQPAFPDRPVRVIVPLAPGGPADMVARRLADGMSRVLRQGVVVENRSGGGSIIGAQAVARAEPDGYTLLFGSGTTHSVAPAVMASVPYRADRDFEPIMRVGASAYIFVVRRGLPAGSMRDVLELAARRPGSMTFGSFGPGSASHLGLLLLQMQARVEFVHVPYRGAGPVLTALASNEVDTALVTPDAADAITSGSLRGFATLAARRLSLLPQVPTAAEVGLPDWRVPIWNGLFAPAGTPPDRRARIQAAAREALLQPDLAAFLTRIGIEPTPESEPDAFRRELEAERHAIEQVVQVSGLERQ